MSTRRSQRTYDQRLVHLVRKTDDITLCPPRRSGVRLTTGNGGKTQAPFTEVAGGYRFQLGLLALLSVSFVDMVPPTVLT